MENLNQLLPNIKDTKKLYLVNILFTNLSKQPLFITDNPTFGVNFFNQWKKQNGRGELLCQIEPMILIESQKYEKTDIQTSILEI